MKLIEKYPDITYMNDDDCDFIRSQISKPCTWCLEPTEFIEIYYEGPFCSDECLEKFENSLFRE